MPISATARCARRWPTDLPMLLYETGEARRFNEPGIRIGTRGILSVMRHIGMLPRRKPAKRTLTPAVCYRSTWARAGQSGILRRPIALGRRVEPEQPLGVISDPFGASQVTVTSPTAGLVIGRTIMPLLNEGNGIFHIAETDVTVPMEKWGLAPDPDINRRDEEQMSQL